MAGKNLYFIGKIREISLLDVKKMGKTKTSWETIEKLLAERLQN
jgi:hypothetical protein